MLKKMFVLWFVMLTLNACATPAKYAKKLSLEAGKTEQQLIASWGEPNQIKELENGTKILIYTYKDDKLLPAPSFYNNMDLLDEDEAFYQFTYGGDEIPDGNLLADNITNYCQTIFYLTNNHVTSWKYHGNACVAI